MTGAPDDAWPHDAFEMHFDVPAEAIDALGHVGNLVWLQWVTDLAQRHAESLGLGLEQCKARGGVWVVRRHEVDYLRPAFHADRLRGLTWLENIRGASSRRRTLLLHDADARVAVRAATTWAWVDWRTGKPMRVPQDVVARLQGTAV